MVERSSPEQTGDTRSRILSAAISLFGEQGYAGTSVRDISERLGVTKAALYYHFASKETILDALLEPFLSELGRLAELVRHTPPPSPRTIIERLVEVMAGPGGVLLAFVNDPAVIHRKIGKSDMLSMQRDIVAALAGPDPSDLSLLRAHCALGSARAGIVGMALERAGAVPTGWTSADGPAGVGTVPGPLAAGPPAEGSDRLSESLCSIAARVPRTLAPLVSTDEQRAIVAASLAALGPVDPMGPDDAGAGPAGSTRAESAALPTARPSPEAGGAGSAWAGSGGPAAGGPAAGGPETGASGTGG